MCSTDLNSIAPVVYVLNTLCHLLWLLYLVTFAILGFLAALPNSPLCHRQNTTIAFITSLSGALPIFLLQAALSWTDFGDRSYQVSIRAQWWMKFGMISFILVLALISAGLSEYSKDWWCKNTGGKTQGTLPPVMELGK